VLVEAGVQAEVYAEAKLMEEAEATTAVVEAELEAKELALEGEVRDARALLEEFRLRLEEIEARVSAMAEEERSQVSPQQQQPQPQAQGSFAARKDTHDKAVEAPSKKAVVVPELDPTTAVEISTDEGQVGPDVSGVYGDSRVVQHVNLEPTTMSDLPSYVLLVGLGVCAVVLQVVLKRVGGRSLKP
jgi:cobalamin biosynthesis Mg chelatase CobN